jgi:hypothetical protein
MPEDGKIAVSRDKSAENFHHYQTAAKYSIYHFARSLGWLLMIAVAISVKIS